MPDHALAAVTGIHACRTHDVDDTRAWLDIANGGNHLKVLACEPCFSRDGLDTRAWLFPDGCVGHLGGWDVADFS